MDNLERGYVTIDLDAIVSNMNNMKANIADKTKMVAVIKTDGYGHGAIEIGRTLEPLDYIWGYATATAEEAHTLRANGLNKPILILGYTFPYSYNTLVTENIRPAVFRSDMLKQLNDAAKACGTKAAVHIKVDTGMSRIGIKPDESGIEFVKEALSYDNLYVEGIFTHMARADEADKKYAMNQINLFKAFCEQIKEQTGYDVPLKHCSNSAGIIELPEANMDMVRAGITLYGLWPSDEVKKDIVDLKPALSFISHIAFIKEVEPNTAVSYGGTFVAQKKMLLATVPIGYGDGYPRGLSNKGFVLVEGQRAPICGRVCMDQFMIDVTQIKGVKEGSKVTLIGCDGAEAITMEELGDISGRFNYELACDIGKRIPRVYLRNGNITNISSEYMLINS